MISNSIPHAWRNVVLGDVTSEVSERVGKGDEGHRIYGVERATGLTPTPKYVAKDVSRYKKIQPGMFAYNPMRLNIGSLGFCSPKHHSGAVSPDYVVFQCDPLLLDPLFMNYVTQSQEWDEWVRGAGVGSVRVRIYYRELARMPLRIPPMDEQRAIAAVLGALDDKIEQNRRVGRTQEGLARATFKAWFVNFEPVKAKAAGHTSFPGMPADAFAALPDCLTPSPHGPVPQGWALQTLADVVDINPPRRLSKGQDAPYLDMKNMPTDGHAPDSWERRPHGSGMRFINGDTLVARITPCLENGKTAYIDFLGEGEVAWGSTEYIVLRPKPPLPSVYAYCLARTSEFRDFAIQNMTGTSGRQRVAASALNHYHIAVPDAATAAAFGDVVVPLFECIRASKAESSKLVAMRAYLLPRLLSGSLHVKLKGAS